MPNPGQDEHPNELQILDNLSFLTGVFFDSCTGPVTASCRAAVLNSSNTERVRPINDSVIEDVYPENELDAHYGRLGWPPPSRLPSKPWDVLTPRSQRALKTEIWASRKFMVQRWNITLSPQDLRPAEALVDAVEAALSQRTTALRVRALREVFTTWGEMIPVNAVVGACLAATGTLNDRTILPDSCPPSRSPPRDGQNSLADIVDRQLGTTWCFARRLESRVQGGASDTLMNEGYEAWLRSVSDTPSSWRIIKVNHAIPITDILDSQLRDRLEQVFTNSIIFRSPGVGIPQAFSFDSAVDGLRCIEKITIWFSNLRIQDISVTYTRGVSDGPYSFGLSNQKSKLDSFLLGSGEYITDVFVWQHKDGWIAGIQFVKSGLECSPIYGAPEREGFDSCPSVLLGGNGNALLGLSGMYTSDSIGQIKAVWRSDLILRRQRHTQTSFAGMPHGIVFNDLQYLGDPATSRIVQITARTGESVASFRTTYVSTSEGGLVRSETPARGWDKGPLVTMTLDDGEYITGVRGAHKNGGLQRIQFITNKRTHPAFGADSGEVPFSFDAPKTRDGRDMVLHYFVGKNAGWLHSLLFVWAEMPLQLTGT